jgi:hypothetical protein
MNVSQLFPSNIRSDGLPILSCHLPWLELTPHLLLLFCFRILDAQKRPPRFSVLVYLDKRGNHKLQLTKGAFNRDGALGNA